MPIPDFNTYKNKVTAPFQTLHSTKVSVGVSPGRLYSFWPIGADAGAVPTTAAVPVNNTLGGIGQINSNGTQRLAQIEASSTLSGCWILVDRLSHQGGLSATVTGNQTTNLPTAALTRCTTGEGVMMGLEIYTTLGTTSTTVTATYTNSSGVGSRTTEATSFGNTFYREVNRLIILPLQEDDNGVRSVQSVNVVATTGTAGNFGVTLFKPLFIMPLVSPGAQASLFDGMLSMAGNLPKITNSSSLQWIFSANGGTSGVFLSVLKLIEE